MGSSTQDEKRSSTDHSLEEERSKTDTELAEAHAKLEQDADQAVRVTRERADAMVARSRNEQDRDRPDASARSSMEEQIDRERQQEDTLVKTERAAADALVINEREGRRALLNDLLSAERESTDRYLAGERAFADDALATRDSFLGIVSHDVRTLLAHISLSAQSILRQAPGDDTGAQICKQASGIRRSVQHMTRLVGDLLDAVSMDAGHLSVTPGRHDVIQLLREATDSFQPIAAEKGIRLDVDVDQAPLWAQLDELRILQVLTNLLSNAIKYSPQESVISVSAEEVGSEVTVTVRDQGVGIAQEMLELIFDRFRRVDPTERSGFGLGLFISKSIVEAHGGRIWAASTSGQGSTFKFTLPSAAAPEDGARNTA